MTINELIKNIVRFRDKRKWKKQNTPKDLAMALICEAAELTEHFKYHQGKEMKQYIDKHKEEIGDELSDVLYWVLLMSHDLHIDIAKAFQKKLQKLEKKYPVNK